MNSTNNQIVNQINIIIGKYVKNYTNKISKKYNIEKKELSDMWNEIITEEKEEFDLEEDYEVLQKCEDTYKTNQQHNLKVVETEELVEKSDEELVGKIEKPIKKTRKKKQTSEEELENIWKVQKQLGESGKEGTCYLVINKLNEEYAMKQFKPRKSKAKFDKEVSFQTKAGILGLAPKVIDVMYDPPRIVMEIMNRTIEQVIKDQDGFLTEDQQNDIISLCQKLDENNIYHCDPNPLNLMEGIDGKFKWIDYGMSIDINVKKHTNSPNVKSLKTVFYGGMQGLVSRKICTKNNITKINEIISLYYTI